MIVLDTNVISELMRPEPHPAVFAWLAAQPREAVYTTSVTKAEIFYGIAVLPEGRRRRALASAAEDIFEEDFNGRVLPFDDTAARQFADIVASRRRTGKPIGTLDALIAATARVAGAEVATRDVTDFADCDIVLINPWTVR